MLRHAVRPELRHLPSLDLLAVVAAAVVALTWWAWHAQPPTRLVGSQRVAGGTIVPLERAGDRPRAWSAELRLGSTPEGMRWSLFEGAAPGEGYELRWLPDLPGLALWRSQRPFLLGTVTCAQPPGRVALVRRGARFEVFADGRSILVCIDPMGMAEPSEAARSWAWGCRADPALPDAVFTVQLLDAAQEWGADVPVRAGPNPELEQALAGEHAAERPDRPLLLLRQALALVEAGRDPVTAGFALGQARIAIDPRSVLAGVAAGAPSGEDLDHLRLWLALGRVRLAMATRGGSGDPQRADAGVVDSELAELAAIAALEDAPPELPGILLSLLPALGAAATWTPDYPRDPGSVLAARVPWLRLLGETATAAQRSPLPPDLRLQARLVAHAAGSALRQLGADPGAGALTGDLAFAPGPLPTPVAAPLWLTGRWRALAGADPAVQELPPLPWPADGPLPRCLDRLAEAAGITPLAAAHLRQEVLRLAAELRRQRGGEQEASFQRELDDALDAAPPREAALARALTALAAEEGGNRLSRLQEARKDLLASLDGATPEQTDAVAFALLMLIEVRQPELVGDADRARRSDAGAWIRIEGDGWLRRLPLPRRLAAYAALLDGRPRSTDQVWIGDLHPTQALVAALVMQQVARETARRWGDRGPLGAGESTLPAVPEPDWSLLRRMPCLTLPAELLIPAEAPSARGAGGDPAGSAVIP